MFVYLNIEEEKEKEDTNSDLTLFVGYSFLCISAWVKMGFKFKFINFNWNYVKNNFLKNIYLFTKCQNFKITKTLKLHVKYVLTKLII